jgi:hypothetical protein
MRRHSATPPVAGFASAPFAALVARRVIGRTSSFRALSRSLSWQRQQNFIVAR